MELLIDIPKEVRDIILRDQKNNEYLNIYERAIANGTPLPKGHGRLIDADELDVTTVTTDDYSGNEVLDVVLKDDIDEAPTVLEASKE